MTLKFGTASGNRVLPMFSYNHTGSVSRNLANRGATFLPWVASLKPEKRVLEIEGHPRDLQVSQHASLATDSV